MATTKNSISRTQQQSADQALIDGLKKHEAILASLLIGGTSYKTADIIATLQSRIDARNAAVSSRATWQAEVKADRDTRTKTKALVSGLRQALAVMFAGSIDALADFGLKPRKARVVTPEQKQAAALKAKATRAARGTMGSQQKKAVKGSVTGVVVTPIVAPKPVPAPSATQATPPPAAAPAATASAPAATVPRAPATA
ncbi:MAG TPA: hypothetical protein VE987_05355 [Polyangiaceae bacterium]|nr:hypothetical protein [Polyangiaceae bacterium]